MHINKTNQKRYIGVTKKPPQKRWGLNGINYKKQSYFYNAIQKYGWDNFEHIVVKENLSKTEAFELEKEYIKKYSSNNHDYGYNICSGGIGGCGLCGELNPMYGVSVKDRMDSQTYEKWLLSHQTQDHTKFYKKVICLTTMEVFESSKFASDKYKIQRSDINSCCNGKLYTAGKHPETQKEMVWQFYDDYLKNKEKPNKKTISVYCTTTHELFKRATDAAKKYNLNPSGITLCCQGKQTYCGMMDGVVLQWMYYSDYVSGKNLEIVDKRVICLNTYTVYANIAKAEKETGVSHAVISQCCNGNSIYGGKINGEKGMWMKYSDYLNGCTLRENRKQKAIICINDGNVFDSIKEANLYYGIKRKSGISDYLGGRAKYVLDKNKNHLYFEYYANK